jgi:hypothetical protein
LYSKIKIITAIAPTKTVSKALTHHCWLVNLLFKPPKLLIQNLPKIEQAIKLKMEDNKKITLIFLYWINPPIQHGINDKHPKKIKEKKVIVAF